MHTDTHIHSSEMLGYLQDNINIKCFLSLSATGTHTHTHTNTNVPVLVGTAEAGEDHVAEAAGPVQFGLTLCPLYRALQPSTEETLQQPGPGQAGEHRVRVNIVMEGDRKMEEMQDWGVQGHVMDREKFGEVGV